MKAPTKEECPFTGRRYGLLLFVIGVLYLAAMGIHSLQSLPFSPDSMIYIDVAQNIASVRGLSHSYAMTSELDRLPEETLLPPMLLWGPLYPLSIALAHFCGLPFWAAALLIPVFFGGVLLYLVFVLITRLYDRETAAVAVAFLAVSNPFRFTAGHAWSETLGMACLFAGLCFLVGPPGKRNAFFAGLFLGLAFTARYALLPGALLGVLAVAERKSLKRSLRNIVFLSAGFALPAIPVLIRNLLLSGSAFGSERLPSTVGFFTNLHYALDVMFRQYLPTGLLERETQARLLIAACVLTLGVAFLRKRLGRLKNALLLQKRWILPLWGIGYALFLVLYRSVVHTDWIDVRLLSPALVALIPFVVALVVSGLGPHRILWRSSAVLLLSMAFVLECVHLYGLTPETISGRREASARLAWIAENTTPDDLIIGDSTMDIPLYCGFRRSLCFIPGEHEDLHPEFEVIQNFLMHHQQRFQQVYLIVRSGFPDEEGFEAQWKAYTGPFITDLIYGRMDQYPGIRRIVKLRDAHVFLWTPRR